MSSVYTLYIFSFRMTEDEREEAQEQLKALNQAYNELSQNCSDQTNSAEEVRCFTVSSVAYSLIFCQTTVPPAG